MVDAFEFKPLAELLGSFIAINRNFVLLAPTTDALDHDAVATAERSGRWNDNVGNPMYVHGSIGENFTQATAASRI